MKNISIAFLILILAAIPSACCISKTTEYVTDTITTTSSMTMVSTLTQTSTLTATLTATKTVIQFETDEYTPPGWGTIRLPVGENLYDMVFYFQRIPDDVTESIIFQGVVFTPQSYEGAITIAPVNYDFFVQFPDGSNERMRSAGVGMVNQIKIDLTGHENPRVGVMLVWADSNLSPSIFLLIGES